MTRYPHVFARVTRRCQLSCPDCFLKLIPGTEETTEEQWDRIVGRLAEMQVKADLFTFTGGEPTLWKPLADATKQIKDAGVTKRVRVITNAVKHGLSLKDFGDADIIKVSDYGAMSRTGLYNLLTENRKRKWFTRSRVMVSHVKHDDLEIPKEPKPIPARCRCDSVVFCGDQVYPCTYASMLKVNGCSIEEDFVSHLNKIDRTNQDICKICFLNAVDRVKTPLVIEWFVWESRIGHVVIFPWRFNWLRWTYARAVRWLRR